MPAVEVIRLTGICLKIIELSGCIGVGIFQCVWFHAPLAGLLVIVTAGSLVIEVLPLAIPD